MSGGSRAQAGSQASFWDCPKLRPNIRAIGFPVGLGTAKEALCRRWLRQPGQPHVPWPCEHSRGHPGSRWPQRHLCQDRAWLSRVHLPLLSSVLESEVLGLCHGVQQTPVFWHGALWPGIDSWYAAIPQPGHLCGTMEPGGRESQHPGKATLCSPPKWWNIPDMPHMASSLATSFPRAIPIALPCQGFLSSRLCLKPKEGGAGMGQHCGCGGRGSPLHPPWLAMTLACSAKL